MRKNIKAILIILILVLSLSAFMLISFILKRIPSNDPSTIGNTAGNLQNNGLFAQSGDVVYFSNPYDIGNIYSMNKDETNIKKVNNSNCSLICVAGDYLYYYMDTASGGKGLGGVVRNQGVYRSKTNGKYSTSLDRVPCTALQVIGDYVFYQRYDNKEFSKTYRVNTDKSDPIKISESVINPVCAYNGILYFSGTEKDHYLYSFDTRTNTVNTVFTGNIYNPQYNEGYIYYMDVSAKYRLCRVNLSSLEVQVLTSDRVDMFNVGDAYIYYQKNDSDNPALMRIRIDGSNPEVVMEGIFTDINLTSEYAYFHSYYATVPVYHTPVNGPIFVTTFDAANEAVKK